MASSSTIRCASRALTMAGVHPVSTEFINLDTNRVPRAGKTGTWPVPAENLIRTKNGTAEEETGGELLLVENAGKTVEAEDSFHAAINVSRSQGSRLLGLRATTSLARLLAKQGKRDEGRAMLAGIYNLVRRGLRHRRPQGRQGTARRPD